jgi:hypothetical protein
MSVQYLANANITFVGHALPSCNLRSHSKRDDINATEYFLEKNEMQAANPANW